MLKLRSLTAQCESNVPRLGSETWLSSADRLQLGGTEFGLEESEGRTRQFWKDLAQRTDHSFSFSEHVLRKRYQFLLELREGDLDAMQQAAVPSSLAGRAYRAKTAWEAPPLPPDKFVSAVREVHARRRADPDGWPWTQDPILSEGYFLDDSRDLHFVTAELLKQATSLSVPGQIALASGVRYRQSGRRLPSLYAQAIRAGSLSEAILRPVHFQAYPPYRNVVRKDELARAVEAVAAAAAAEVPFPSLVTARDFFKIRLRDDTAESGASRRSTFAAAEVARDLFALGLVQDGGNAPMETGARAGLSLARRFFLRTIGHKRNSQWPWVRTIVLQKSCGANTINIAGIGNRAYRGVTCPNISGETLAAQPWIQVVTKPVRWRVTAMPRVMTSPEICHRHGFRCFAKPSLLRCPAHSWVGTAKRGRHRDQGSKLHRQHRFLGSKLHRQHRVRRGGGLSQCCWNLRKPRRLGSLELPRGARQASSLLRARQASTLLRASSATTNHYNSQRNNVEDEVGVAGQIVP